MKLIKKLHYDFTYSEIDNFSRVEKVSTIASLPPPLETAKSRMPNVTDTNYREDIIIGTTVS